VRHARIAHAALAVMLAAALSGCAPEPVSSTLIVNASIVDGTGSPARAGAVRIDGDRIVEVGDLEPKRGEQVVDDLVSRFRRRRGLLRKRDPEEAACVLIALGAFGLARGEFSYTEEKHEAEIAGIELAVKDKETVAVPQWLSIGAIALGAILLVAGRRKS